VKFYHDDKPYIVAVATIVGSWCAVVTGHVTVNNAIDATVAALGLASLHSAIKAS